MSQKRRVQKLGLAVVVAGALSLSTWTGAEARPFGLLLGGGFHHLGGFGGGFRPLGGGFHGGPFGFRQPGLGQPGFRQAGPGYRGFGSAGGGRRWQGGSGRGRYLGAYGAAAAAGAMGTYADGYPTTDSGSSGYPYGYYGYRPYGY